METTVRNEKKKDLLKCPGAVGLGLFCSSSLEPASFPRPRKCRGSQVLFLVPQQDP